MPYPSLFGLDRLSKIDNGHLSGFWVGQVVNSRADDRMGRIKVRIESLFGTDKEGISDADLPWVQMMPSTGCFVRPRRGDFVTVVFQSCIYEGFYIGHQVHRRSSMDGGSAKLNEYFELDFHNTFIYGRYDGSSFTIDVNGIGDDSHAQIHIDGEGDIFIRGDGDIDIDSSGHMDIVSSGDMLIESEGTITMNSRTGMTGPPQPTGPFCAMPFHPLTGAPMRSNKAI
jgi:hypothetical protein